jgi:hypothetical protein
MAQKWEQVFLEGEGGSLPMKLPVFERFKRVFLSSADAQAAQMARTAQRIAASVTAQLTPFAAQLAAIEIPSPPPGLDALALNHVSVITPLLSGVSAILAGYQLPSALMQDAARDLLDSIVQGAALTRQLNAVTKLSADLASTLRVRDAWINESLSQVASIARVMETHQGVLDQIREVISAGLSVPPALATLQRDILAQAQAANSLSETLRTDLIVPAQATSLLLGTIHHTSAREAGTSVRSETIRPSERQVRGARLAIQLGTLSLHFAAQWEGAWLSLGSDNPDRLRQAAHSGREVLRQVLEHLAPDHTFTQQEIREDGHNGQVTRKMRLARILGVRLGSSQVAFIEQMVKAIDALYGRLSADAHDQTGAITEVEIEGLLMALDGVLVLVLGTDKR